MDPALATGLWSMEVGRIADDGASRGPRRSTSSKMPLDVGLLPCRQAPLLGGNLAGGYESRAPHRADRRPPGP